MGRTISIIIIAALFLSACKKSSPSGGNVVLPAGYYFVKNVAVISYNSQGERSDSTVTSYNYDDQGRSTNLLVQQYNFSIYPQGQLLDSYSSTYTYNSNSIFVNHPGVQSTTYYINPTSKLADSSYVVASGSTTINVARYYYDSIGYLIKSDDYSINDGQYSELSEDDYTISNGNILQDITYNYNNIYSGTKDTVISTFPMVPFPSPNEPVISEYFSSYGIIGKQSTNLLSAITSSFSGVVTSLNYSYTFDSENRVSTLTEQVAATNQIYALVHFYYNE